MVRKYICTSEGDRISASRSRKLVLRIDFEEGKQPFFCAPLPLRPARKVKRPREEGWWYLRDRDVVFENMPHANGALSSSTSLSSLWQCIKPFRPPFEQRRNPFPKLGFADNEGVKEEMRVFCRGPSCWVSGRRRMEMRGESELYDVAKRSCG